MNYKVPFNRPVFSGNELKYVQQAVAAGHISGNGAFTQRCCEMLTDIAGATHALLTTSGTHALEMAALLLEIGPKDEVIVPSFTFPSTAAAFALRGARLVFCDIREDTLNLDVSKLPELIGPRTRAIVPVHYAGVGCEMDAICDLASTAGIAVVEDNAHGLLGRYRGKPLGSLGMLSALSFHETKNFNCGEGGALLINDPTYIEKAEIIQEKGTNRSQFFRGEVDKYTWVGLGSSYAPSDLLAAILLAQLEQRELLQQHRRQAWERYHAELTDWANEQGILLPAIPGHCESSYHLFHMLAPNNEIRDALLLHLRQAGVYATFHYVPLHSSPMGRQHGVATDCPVSDSISQRLLRLPLYSGLSEDEQSWVIASLLNFHLQKTT